MTAVTYTAQRSLISGHTAATVYNLNLVLLAETPGHSRKPNNITNESLSGARENITLNRVKYYDIQLAPLQGAALAAVLEFLDSVESGEQFSFDMYGTTGSPVNIETAELETGGYSLTRFQRASNGGANDYFTLSFRVRVLL